ncbi:hypothetical protein Scep_001631 [Stephania cephalantha]|uniref:protein-serine/threonine phosphatase n=1 Tax=Stephania cephalantha TaxID=152367 RepID=A0AAP0LB63_9MAGN
MEIEQDRVSLGALLKRESQSEKLEKPGILHGQAGQSKKGEDFTLVKTECQRIPGDGSTTFSVFALFDGHNGSAAALYCKENLLSNVLCGIPSDLGRDEWLAALPRAMVAGFVKTDKDFQEKAKSSGTTATLVIIDGMVVTVASVGDSHCVLESADGTTYHLSADHRLEFNDQEVERVTISGGEVGRLNIAGGTERVRLSYLKIRFQFLDWSSEMLARWFVPFKINWRQGCWRVYRSCSLREASEAFYRWR